MAQFSSKERIIARALSSMPAIKKTIKKIYISVNAIVHRRPYRFKILDNKYSIKNIGAGDNEVFFGYYDKTCEQNGLLIYHKTNGQLTKKIPTPNQPVDIILRNIKDGNNTKIGTTFVYNWQQGARTQWLDKTQVIYNDVEGNKYVARIYNTSTGITSTVPYPVQETLPDGLYLSINYKRIMKLRPDYGYRNLPLPSDLEMKDYDSDGIWIVDCKTESGKLLHSLANIKSVQPKAIYDKCIHVVNHLMASPDGKGFIFIHRYYEGKQRHDRLMYSDFKNLYVIVDEDMVSHCHWLDDTSVIGYFRYNNKDGFYKINILTKDIKEYSNINSLGLGDGHPTVSKDYIVFDTYPDKSRMQHLFILNKGNNEIHEIAELYHPLSYMDECRCDLHPRFSDDGKRLYFDTVYTGKRNIAYIDLV